MTDILIEPVLSEKATALREQGNYTFKVALTSTNRQESKAKKAEKMIFYYIF